MEHPSPLISWVNRFPRRFINRTILFCNTLESHECACCLLPFLYFHWLFPLWARETSPGNRSIYKFNRERACVGDGGSIWWAPGAMCESSWVDEWDLSLIDSLVLHQLASCFFCARLVLVPAGGDGIVSPQIVFEFEFEFISFANRQGHRNSLRQLTAGPELGVNFAEGRSLAELIICNLLWAIWILGLHVTSSFSKIQT